MLHIAENATFFLAWQKVWYLHLQLNFFMFSFGVKLEALNKDITIDVVLFTKFSVD